MYVQLILKALATASLACVILVAGCEQSNSATKPKPGGADVNVDAPGVKVHVDSKKDGDDKKAGVDVDVNRGGVNVDVDRKADGGGS